MVKITYENGIPFIDIDGKLLPPAAFRSFRPKPDNISLMKRSGIKLYQLLVAGMPCTNGSPYSLFGGVWTGDGRYNFYAFDKQMEMFLRYAPEDAYFNVMMQLDMPLWWGQSHEGDANSYRHITEAALNEEWRTAAADYMKALITYAEEKYGDRIFGYSIAAGLSNEWFDASIQDNAFDRSNTKLTEKWRALIGKPDAIVPSRASLELGEGSLRAPDSDDYKYLELASQGTSDLICHFAKEAQTVLKHKKLFGLFYGYVILEAQIMWNTNAYESVWQCPDIDMLYSPASYGCNRDLGGVGSYQYAVDSIRVNNKLYLHENDHRTELSFFPLENGAIINDGYNNFRDWEQVFRRELANTMVKHSAFWWFDFFGGYYGAPEYEAELTLECKIFDELSKGSRESVSEIAIFVDPMSFVCTKQDTKLCTDLARDNVNELHRCGAPFEYYNLSDITKLDLDRYNLFVFLNCYELKHELREFIDAKLAGKTKLFIHGAGMADGDLDISRTAELTGMQIEQFDAPGMKAVYNGREFGFTREVSPMLRVNSQDDAQVLASYTDGSAAVVRKDDVVWSAMAPIPWQLYRDIARDAGVHIYDENGGGLAVCSQFICAYTTLREQIELKLTVDGTYVEMFSGVEYTSKDKKLCYKAEPGTTMLFVKK